jgi:hypothetical protein
LNVRWLVALIAVLTAQVDAAPQVEIKAQTRLALESVKLQPDGAVLVSGRLVDKLTSDGIAQQTVTIALGNEGHTSYTGADGRFTAVFDVVPGPLPIELRFPGGRLLDRAESVAQVVDPTRAEVTLGVQAEPAQGGVLLRITTKVEDTAEDLPVQIAVGDATADAKDLIELARDVPSGKPYLVTRALAKGGGPRRARVTFPGDARRQQASTEVTFDLATETATTMELAAASLAFEDDVVVTGKVTDEDGQPVGHAAVTLLAGDRRLAQGATEDDGGFKFSVEAEIVAQNQQLPRDFGIQVLAEPASSFIRPSKSNPGIVHIAAPQPVPVSYTVVAFLATALAAGGFFTARAKPWRRGKKKGAPAEGQPSEEHVAGATGGLVANKPGLVSTLRRPSDDGFAGAVRDTVRGRPIADAAVTLVLASDPQVRFETQTGDDGGFALERLQPGEWRAEVAAPGHISERFAVAIPHRGELRGVRVDLVPVRERVFQLYRRAAEPSLPEARLWGIWSPRQIVDFVRARRPSPALAQLTDFVEEAYFSQRVLAESMLPDASEQVDRAIRERAKV